MQKATNIVKTALDGIDEEERIEDLAAGRKLDEIPSQTNEDSTSDDFGEDCPRALKAFLDLFVDYRPAARPLVEAYHAGLPSYHKGTMEDDEEMNGSGFDYEMDPGLAGQPGHGTSELALGRIKSLIEKVTDDQTSPVMLIEFSENNRDKFTTTRPLSGSTWCIY
ncbi:MAG: hypothetical protein MJZ81_09210 [Bacteroidales bacterium]|nr:hypothetical protein [Bacteroidales bacterium]